MYRLIDCSKLPIVTAENAKVGGLYKFAGGYMVLTSVYEPTREEIAEHELIYNVRCTWIDFNGISGGCGLA